MSWLGDLVGGISDVWDVVKPIAKPAYDYYAASRRNDIRQNLVDEMRAIEDMKYNAAQAQYDAYLQQAMGAGGEGGGGGGGGMGAASIQAAYGPALAALEPYAQFGPRLMKQGAKAYKRGNKGLRKMQKFAFSPASDAVLAQENTPAWTVDIPLPDYLRK